MPRVLKSPVHKLESTHAKLTHLCKLLVDDLQPGHVLLVQVVAAHPVCQRADVHVSQRLRARRADQLLWPDEHELLLFFHQHSAEHGTCFQPTTQAQTASSTKGFLKVDAGFLKTRGLVETTGCVVPGDGLWDGLRTDRNLDSLLPLLPPRVGEHKVVLWVERMGVV